MKKKRENFLFFNGLSFINFFSFVCSFVCLFVCLPDSFIHSFTTTSSRFCYSVSCFSYNSLMFLMCTIQSHTTVRATHNQKTYRERKTQSRTHTHMCRIRCQFPLASVEENFPCWLHTVLQLNPMPCFVSLWSSFVRFFLAVLIKRKTSSSKT